ncbi:uncharacterized protein [Gossypium hirsutum]|uniref:Uncharacterized protein isoform X1 n=1 Tax=Gossypium hirsutum TaxID=3635 RepID=A0ABM2YZ77_GOSHI|nr:uncharacterized protein LOC107952056 isoform X1 [Gossypium hirsutum]
MAPSPSLSSTSPQCIRLSSETSSTSESKLKTPLGLISCTTLTVGLPKSSKKLTKLLLISKNRALIASKSCLVQLNSVVFLMQRKYGTSAGYKYVSNMGIFFFSEILCVFGGFLDNRISISMSKHKYLKKIEELKHHRRGLITRNVKDAVDLFHQRFGMMFSPALSREFRPYKPNPAPLLHICSTWDVQPNEVMMVGDSLKDDVACGKNAGALTCLLDENGRYGSQDFANLDLTPDFKVSSLIEVHSLLKSNFDLTP